MPASTNKKVLLVRFDRETLAGFVQTPGGLGDDAVELLTPEGSLLRVPYSQTKLVCFVRDFEVGESWRNHRSFSTRPKSPGLWVRLRFRDSDWIEGVLPNNLMLLEPHGVTVTPPDPSFQNQRIFVPRAALETVQVLGVIGSPLRRPPKKEAVKSTQIDLFE